MIKKNALIDLRIDKNKIYNEQREQIDIKWFKALKKISYNPLILSSYSYVNKKDIEQFCLTNKIKLIILSGGGNIYSNKNYEKIRLKFSYNLINVALENRIKLIGICRGAQAILKFYNIKTQKIKNHVRKKNFLNLTKKINDLPNKTRVTCYHNYAIMSNKLNKSFESIYEANDGTSEVFFNKKRKQIGIMWHPERENKDLLFKKITKLIN